MSEHLVTLDSVGIAFDMRLRIGGSRFWALEDVSLTLSRGDRLGIIGRNGAGKSTLLRVIADILAPDRGRVTRTKASCQLLSLALGFLPHLSGRDNAILSGLMLGLHATRNRTASAADSRILRTRRFLRRTDFDLLDRHGARGSVSRLQCRSIRTSC